MAVLMMASALIEAAVRGINLSRQKSIAISYHHAHEIEMLEDAKSLLQVYLDMKGEIDPLYYQCISLCIT